MGFTTRSDLGPASQRPALGQKPAGDAEAAKGEEGGGSKQEGQFDAFMGNDAGLFAQRFDDEDREADEIWDKVDARMLERRKRQREENAKRELEEHRRRNPKITEQFQDLKRELSTMTQNDWDAIPEIGDRSVKRQPRGKASYVPVPDTLLQRAAQERQSVSQIDEQGGDAHRGGMATTTTDLTAVGESRGTVLSMKLDSLGSETQISQSGLQSSVDPKGYLTSLQSSSAGGLGSFQQNDIQDVKKARKLLQSVTATNPSHAPGWIAAARLESDLGKAQKARALIAKGCAACPKSEDIWLHASLLQQTPDEKKVCIARGLAQVPKSVRLWLEAARLESPEVSGEQGRGDQATAAQRRVLRKALERLPNSVRLWRALVDLSSEEDARVLLRRATECCPQHKELWLALARLETHERARKVLNKARQTLPTEPLIWVAAAKLEEANLLRKRGALGAEEEKRARLDPETSFGVFAECGLVAKIVDRAVKSLKQNGAVVTREQWLAFAEDCERQRPQPALGTCAQLVKRTVGEGVEEEDAKKTWVADAEELERRGSVHTARCVLHHALSKFPAKKGLWRRAALLEKRNAGDPEVLDAILARATTYCPRSELLWLMGAKERWLRGDVAGARAVLSEAFAANPESEEVVLAAFKLEFENDETERAKVLLARARSQGGGPRVWLKSALLERELGNPAEERSILAEGLSKHGKDQEDGSSWKMHVMLAQNAECAGDLAGARAALERGRRDQPKRWQVWACSAALEERHGSCARARAQLEQARLRVPGEPNLWLAAVRTERRQGNHKQADALMAKALQDCPESGQLWADVIEHAPRPQRKSKSVDALKKCKNDPRVVRAVAGLFAQDAKIEKARSWYDRSVKLDRDDGDAWASYYLFECRAGLGGRGELEEEVARRCEEAQPKHGERWQRIAKEAPRSERGARDVLRKTALDLEANPIPRP